MSTERETEHHPHRNRHLAQKFENLIGVLMVVEAGLMWKYVKAGPPPEDEVLARSDDDAELTFAY